jgi:hypothetical protein
MESINNHSESLFNGHIETALRAIIILEAFYPDSLDLESISLLDYFSVHTGDINGPPSLHPAVSSRVGEYRVRRRTIQDSLSILIRRNLATVIEDKDGIRFIAADDSPAFIKLLTTQYNSTLKDRANWLASQKHHRTNLFLDLRSYITTHTINIQFDEGFQIA